MDLERIKDDVGQTWRWLAEGWRHLSERAAHALTYFTPETAAEAQAPDSTARFGVLAVDVSERDDAFLIELEAPGLDRDEIDVSIEGSRVVVTGTKRIERERREGKLRITERAFGSFQRTLPLPTEVTADGAEAAYKRGVLKLKVPKRRAPQSRRVEVLGG